MNNNKETNLGLGVSRRLNRALSVADLLQNTPAFLHALGQGVLLLCDFGQQHAQLVGDLGDGVIARLLTPVAELRGDRSLLLGSVLVGTDGMVLGLDQLVQLLGQLGLLDPTETSHGKAMFAARTSLARAMVACA